MRQNELKQTNFNTEREVVMKTSMQIFLSGSILMAGFASNAMAQSECPALAGRYEASGDVMTIIEKRVGPLYLVTLGEGAFEMTVDGKVHATPDGTAQYQAWCAQGVLNVKVSAGGESGLMKYYFANPQTLIEENSGLENYTRNWTKK